MSDNQYVQNNEKDQYKRTGSIVEIVIVEAHFSAVFDGFFQVFFEALAFLWGHCFEDESAFVGDDYYTAVVIFNFVEFGEVEGGVSDDVGDGADLYSFLILFVD